MTAILTFKKAITVTVSAAAVALAGSGCTAVTAGVAMPDKAAVDMTTTAGDTASAIDSSACTQVDEHKIEIPAVTAAEPQLRIPEPAGWEGSTEFATEEAENLRFRLVNSPSATSDGPRNVVVVGLEEMPDMGVEAIFDQGHAGLVEAIEEIGLPIDMTMTGGTVCGLPAQTYTSEGSAAGMGSAAAGDVPSATYLQVVAQTGGRTYLVCVMTFGDSDSPAYQRDAETILRGFEVLPSANASI
jgi:hypothetical protein